ncbi:hypothetical protein BS17DRAFT_780480, partial [Gyrodon lividus]
DTSADFEGLSFPGALHSPHSPSHPGADAQDVAFPSADRTPIEEAAALVENVLGVFLQPPSEEEASAHELLTPQTGCCTHAHSGDSPSGQSDFPKKKKGKKKAADQSAPSPEVTVASPSPRLLLQLPPCQSNGVPPLVSVLECLSTHNIYCHTIFAQASKGLDLNVPYVVSHLWKVLAEVIPDVDFSDLLEAPILNLPDLNACLLLPGFQLATNSSSVVCSVPVQPEVLDGHKLALPAWVVSVMKESGQALSVKDGVISLSSSHLSAKDEGSLTSQEWLHAFPCLIECILKTLAESVLAASLPLASYPLSVVSGKHLRVSKFASGGMAVAAQNLLAHDATSAPTAGACTLLKSAISNRFFPIITPFLWWKWEELLRDTGSV